MHESGPHEVRKIHHPSGSPVCKLCSPVADFYCKKCNEEFEIDEDLYAPLIPAAMYQGLVLNLFTNAIKALINEDLPTPD